MINIFVISDFIKNKIEVFDNGQTLVYYNTMKPWQIGKGLTIDYLVLVGYTWDELDHQMKRDLFPVFSATNQIIEI